MQKIFTFISKLKLSVYIKKAFQQDESTGKKSVLKKYPNYWEKRKVDKRKHWWFVAPADETDEVDFAIDVIEEVDHHEQVNEGYKEQIK